MRKAVRASFWYRSWNEQWLERRYLWSFCTFRFCICRHQKLKNVIRERRLFPPSERIAIFKLNGLKKIECLHFNTITVYSGFGRHFAIIRTNSSDIITWRTCASRSVGIAPSLSFFREQIVRVTQSHVSDFRLCGQPSDWLRLNSVQHMVSAWWSLVAIAWFFFFHGPNRPRRHRTLYFNGRSFLAFLPTANGDDM